MNITDNMKVEGTSREVMNKALEKGKRNKRSGEDQRTLHASRKMSIQTHYSV